MSQEFVFIAVAISVLVMVYYLVTKSSLREKYAAFWILTSLVFVIFAIFPSIVSAISSNLSFKTTSNFVLGAIIIILLGLVMLISLEIGRHDDKIQTLAEENALLRADIENMKNLTEKNN